jgi:hypothetical protein
MDNITQPSITFLNMTGDVTITWDSANEAEILAVVEQKMKEGFTFFILKPRLISLFGHKKVQVTKVEDVRKAANLVVPEGLVNNIYAKLGDAELESLVAAGQAQVVGRNSSKAPLQTVGRAKSSREVLSHQTVAVRNIVGG